MNKRELEKWAAALKKLDDVETDVMKCGWTKCKPCILGNEEGDCERANIQTAINKAVKRVHDALNDLNKCPNCGKVMDGEL